MKIKNRILYLIIFIILLCIEIFIAVYIHDDIIRPYIGDIIVIPVLYSLIRIFIPEKCRFLPLYIFMFSIFTEFMQYIKIMDILHIENQILRTITGTSFSYIDIVCYFIGSIIITIWEIISIKNSKHNK